MSTLPTKPKEFLDYLNETYASLHKVYEDLFWTSYMGNGSVDARKDKALAARDAFRGNRELLIHTKNLQKKASSTLSARLLHWISFFELFQTPLELQDLKKRIDELETRIQSVRAKRAPKYKNEKGKTVTASENHLREIVATNADELVRRSAFDALQNLPLDIIEDYIVLVGLRNEYAQKLGYSDFYAYKLKVEEGMDKKTLFKIFDEIYDKTKFAFKGVRDLEKTMPGLRRPWNFSYLMAGSFTLEEEPYFQFSSALPYWLNTFSALGVDFRGGSLTLDLLDRHGKYNNGFCHWPVNVWYKDGKRIPGSANFTSNVVLGQVGSGAGAIHTLFHEGGHAAHYLAMDQKDFCLTNEYPPSSTAWAETQSMFMDTIFSSIEWRMRYAKDGADNSYPFDLYERRVRKLSVLRPLGLRGIMSVMRFEKRVYEAKNLTKDFVLKIAKDVYKQFFDMSEDSLSLLNIPHIYSWESSCSYHGYGLAELALTQWRSYFYKKYGYIVDNPHVGKEMSRVWKLGASKTFPELVKLATGKPLSPKAWLENATRSTDEVLRLAKQRIKKLERVKAKSGNLNASIKLVHGKKLIATNAKGNVGLCAKYERWLKVQEKNSKA